MAGAGVSELDLAAVWATRALSAALLFAAFWAGAAVVVPLLRRAAARQPERQDILDLFITGAKWTALVFGALTALGTVGVDVTALVAGLGLTGLTIGFALKDIVANFMAGTMLMLYRPFRRGDTIVVSGLQGVVTALDLRYTHLQASGQRYLIPNATVLNNPVTVLEAAAS